MELSYLDYQNLREFKQSLQFMTTALFAGRQISLNWHQEFPWLDNVDTLQTLGVAS